MTTEQAKEKLIPIIEQAKEDNDACLLVYFSREDDHYKAYTAGMDTGDALMIVNDLMNNFNLDADTIAQTRNSKLFKPAT